ncbi:carbonic anhydrase [Hyaloraphidium curvatum]|nr:carbonic anhydrase [Hyaloraphidium curvatum]
MASLARCLLRGASLGSAPRRAGVVVPAAARFSTSAGREAPSTCGCGGAHAPWEHGQSQRHSAAPSSSGTGAAVPTLHSFLTGTPSSPSSSILPSLSRRGYSSSTSPTDSGGDSFKREVTIEDLLAENRKWAKETRENLPGFFEALSKQQQPDFLWLGCSDSRVPANQIVGLLPGEVFVHRNIANCVNHTDLSCLSVIQYAVEALKVKHIIVCGHYACGGVLAAMGTKQYGLLDNWLRAIKDLYYIHHHQLEPIPDFSARADLLCELNVARSVENVCHTSIVQNAWSRGQKLSVHGWCYRVDDGLIRDLHLSTHVGALVLRSRSC